MHSELRHLVPRRILLYLALRRPMRTMMNTTIRRQLLIALAALPFAGFAQQQPARILVEVWKDPNCGCCGEWIKHLEANGFATKVIHGSNAAMRAKLGIPEQLGSCHTGLVGGYALEGHVPAKDIRRLLKDKPQAVGLAVPGMPVGSPGMDGKIYGDRRDPYDVLLVLKNGDAKVFASYNKA
jgi:hypothetical protein